MVKTISKWVYRRLVKRDALDSKEAVIMLYGIEKIVYNTVFFLLVFILALLMNALLPMLIVLVSFNVIRRVAQGAHFNSMLQCGVTSCIVFVLAVPIVISIPIEQWHTEVLSGCDLLVIGLYAPSDTVKNPIIGSVCRRNFKIKSILISFALVIIAFVIHTTWIKACILYGLTLESFLLLPMTYKLLKQRRNNYEDYKCN